MNKLLSSGIVTAGFVFATSLMGTAFAAGSASLSLSPLGGTYNSGSTFTIEIGENGNGSSVSVVQAILDYSSSQLEYISGSANCSTTFPGIADLTGGSGSVQVSCYVPNGDTLPTGSASVGSASFKVLGSTGSTTITFDGGSIISDSSTNQNIWNGSTSGGTYNLQPQPSSGGGSGTGSSNGGSGSTSGSSNSNSGSSSNNSSNGSGVLGANTSNSSSSTPNSTNQNSTSNSATGASNGSTSGSKNSGSTNSTKPLKNTSKTSFVDYLSGIIAAVVILFVAGRIYLSKNIKPVKASASSDSGVITPSTIAKKSVRKPIKK